MNIIQKVIGVIYIFLGIEVSSWIFKGVSSRDYSFLVTIAVIFILLGLFHILTRRFMLLKFIIDIPIIIFILGFLAFSRPAAVNLPLPPIN